MSSSSDSGDPPQPPVDQNAPGGAADRKLAAGEFRRHRLLRGGATVMVGTVLQKLVNLAFIAVFARALTKGRFDEFAFAVAFGVFFETFSDFGIDFVLTRELNQQPDSEHGRLVGSAMAAKTATFTITLALATAVSFLKPEFRAVALVATLGMFCGIPGTLTFVLIARMRTLIPEASTTISALVTSIALIVAVRAHTSVLVLVAIQLTVRVASSVAFYPWIRRQLNYRLSADVATMRHLLRVAAPIAISTFAVIVYSKSDQIVLGVVGKAGALSGYAVAVKLVESLSFVGAAVATVALPTLSHLDGYDEARFRRITEQAIRYLSLIILPIAVAATLEGGALLGALFGPRFRSEGTVLALLVWAHFFASVWVLARPILIARRRASYLSLLAAVAAVVNVGLNLWLIPAYGGLGAAWGSLISYASPFAFALFVPAIRDSFAAPLRAALRPALSALAVLAVVAIVPGPDLVHVAMFAVLMPALLFGSRSVTPGEIRTLATSFVKGR